LYISILLHFPQSRKVAKTQRLCDLCICLASLREKKSNEETNYNFSNSSVTLLAYCISHLKEIVDKDNTIIITDQNVYNAHTKRFRNWNCIVLKPGEGVLKYNQPLIP
jgi:hypothetical protein